METKKTVTIITVISLLITSIPLVQAGNSSEPFTKIKDNAFSKEIEESTNTTDINKTVFVSIGPNSRLISKIKILEGTFLQKIKTNLLLRKHILPRILPYRLLRINEKIKLQIKYKRNILSPTSPLSYLTAYGKTENGLDLQNITELTKNLNATINKQHTATVTGFKGIFIVAKPQIRRGITLNPPDVIIAGTCDNVKIT
ncbi:MAG: hypothetical protein V5A68_00825 [Candidatus Thermoplasmatota archaeon]